MSDEKTTPDTPEEEHDPLAPMEFTLTRKEVPVKLKHPTTGQVTDYILRELDGEGRDAYLNNLGSRMRHNPKDGTPQGVKNFTGLQSSLVSKCLFTKEGDKPVPETEVQKFPASVQSALFERAKEISGLDDDAEEEAGND